LTEVHRDTILRLLVLAGERCEKLLGEKIRNVPAQDVQLDEIQGFCFKKQKALRPGDDPNFGDAYTFVAIERHTKLVLNFALGKRDQQTTNAFVEGLRLATAPKPYQLTADGFPAYPFAIDATLSDRVDLAQLIKVYRATPEGERRYSPAEVVSTEIVSSIGNPGTPDVTGRLQAQVGHAIERRQIPPPAISSTICHSSPAPSSMFLGEIRSSLPWARFSPAFFEKIGTP